MDFDSPACQALSRIVNDKTILNDMKYLTEFRHSLLLKYCTKRLHFSMAGMIARSELAIMDFNSGVHCEEATRKDGQLKYKLQFTRISQSWVIKKIKSLKDKHYINDLIKEVYGVNMTHEDVSMPDLSHLPQCIITIEEPDKEEPIATMKSRFK